jgi:hypothetical protein
MQAAPAGAVTWFHRNAFAVVPLSLKLQGLGECAELVKARSWTAPSAAGSWRTGSWTTARRP